MRLVHPVIIREVRWLTLAVLWGKAGITVWFFPRNAIPADISADQPNPKGWGKPVADFPSANCNPYEFFRDHYNIFDTTLCGDWAGADSVWKYAGYAGQDQSCASITGYATCQDYVLNQGGAFANAYWEVSCAGALARAPQISVGQR